MCESCGAQLAEKWQDRHSLSFNTAHTRGIENAMWNPNPHTTPPRAPTHADEEAWISLKWYYKHPAFKLKHHSVVLRTAYLWFTPDTHLFDVFHPRVFAKESHGELPWPKHLQHPSDESIIVRQPHVGLEGRVAEVGLRSYLIFQTRQSDNTTRDEQRQNLKYRGCASSGASTVFSKKM